nr:hypothetical protein [Tanacetum cinerariifolium]
MKGGLVGKSVWLGLGVFTGKEWGFMGEVVGSGRVRFIVHEGGKNSLMNFETRSSQVVIERGGSFLSHRQAAPAREKGNKISLITELARIGGTMIASAHPSVGAWSISAIVRLSVIVATGDKTCWNGLIYNGAKFRLSTGIVHQFKSKRETGLGVCTVSVPVVDIINTKDIASVQNSKLNVNFDLQCVTCNGFLFSDNHDSCVLEFINTVNARVESKSVKKPLKRKVWKPTGNVLTNIGYKWRPTGRTFTIVGNACPLTRITTTVKVPLRIPIPLEKAVSTACYTQNHSIVRLRHGKTLYELLHGKLPDLSFLHVFGALCYLTNDSENLRKLQPKADIAMASEQSSSGPALYEMTPATISSRLMPNPTSSTPFVPPSRTDWDMLFQPLFDELLTPPPSVDPPAPEVVAPIDKVVTPEPVESTGLPSSTTVDQDAPSPSKSQTTLKTQPPIIPNDVEKDNYDIEVAHMTNDPFFGLPILEVASDQSSSTDSIHIIVHLDHQISKHNSKWTKDHPLEK